MILSGRDLKWYVQQGKLKIEPVEDGQFQQNGVDLVLANAMPMTSIFSLGCSREYLELPDDLMAFVNLRSTWARCGLFIPPTIVDAGFKGDLTLEIVNYGDQPLPLGQPFAHLIFARLSNPSEPYDGRYQGQMGITKARI